MIQNESEIESKEGSERVREWESERERERGKEICSSDSNVTLDYIPNVDYVQMMTLLICVPA